MPDILDIIMEENKDSTQETKTEETKEETKIKTVGEYADEKIIKKPAGDVYEDVPPAKVELKEENQILIPEEDIPPAYINGEPHRNIDGKYVPENKAQIIFQERKVAREQKRLDYLKIKYGKK